MDNDNKTKTSSFRNLDSNKRALLIELAKSGKYARMMNVKSDTITPVDRGGALPLSFAQQRLWFLAQMDGVSSAYHIPGGFSLRGVLDARALGATLDRVVARHESLRTTFRERDGQAVQVIAAADCGLALREMDLSGIVDRLERQRQLHRLLTEEAETPFDLEQGPLIRATLLRLAPLEHVLFFTIHHIVFDGWSMAVMMNEITALYRSRDALPPLPIQYPDYAHWQRGWLEGDRQRLQADYWQQALAGIPTLLELPTDRPRPAQQSHAGAYQEIVLGAELTKQLRVFSQRHGITLYMTLIASWAALLARLSGQEDIVIGSPTAGRNRSEIENLIGFFINSLALRFQIPATQTVTELLAQTKQRVLDAQQHQDLPIERILDLVRPPRSLAHTPIFQVLFALQNAPQGKLELPGLALSPLTVESSGTAKFDLTFGLQEQDGEIVGTMEYATALYEGATIARHVEHWRTLLEAMVVDDTQAVWSLPVLSRAQRHEVLDEWNETWVARAPRCIHQLFEEQVERTPGGVAVIFEGEEVSYGELNARANRLSHYLRGMGVRPEDRVGLCAQRGVEMVVGLLGILKSGGAYVPLDPTYPKERLGYLVEDSEPTVVLTHLTGSERGAMSEALQRCGVRVLDLVTDSGLWAGESAQNPELETVGLSGRNLAYVIYTSGSTGQPKGVMVEHASVVNLICGHIELCGLEASDRVLQFASFAFDASVEEIYPPLSVGAAIVLRPARVVAPDGEFLRLLREARVTVAELPTAFWQHWAQGEETRAEADLRLVVVGGEKAERRHVDQWRASARGRRSVWLNTYGPTEGTVYAVALKVGPREELPAGEVAIGRPTANTRIYLLDGRGQPVPVGVTGEICIGGAGVARGYWKRAELTAQRFTHDEFAGEAGARRYRSGDLGRWRADGTIEYLGRNDSQVKIRGFRIELGEIEAKLASITGVREAVVLAREDAPGEKRLVAYVVLHAGSTADAASLRDDLALDLAQHMLPSAYVKLSALPLTSNGKLDRQALPMPEREAYTSRGFAAPQGAMEEILADIWAGLLQRESIGRHDNFFELGGHSLLAMQLLSRIRQRLQVEVTLGTIFSQPILSDLAAVIEKTDRSAVSLITPSARDLPPVPSFSQQLLWFLSQDALVSRAYNIHGGIKLRGDLDRDALAAALDRIVARHEALRTTFSENDGQALPVIGAPDCGLALPLLDLSAIDEGLRQGELQRAIDREALTVFDLQRGPLIRALLIRSTPHDHLLFFTLHHIVSDGWSMGVLLNEVSALYSAYATGSDGRLDPLPSLPIQYPDYARWQREWLSGDRQQRQTDYWRRTLQGIPVLLDLPTDRPRPARQSFAGDHYGVEFDEDLSGRLKAFSQRHGVTVFMTLISSWAAFLGRWSGQSDIVIGTPIAGRSRSETENLIGFFINLLVLRFELEPEQSVAGLLALSRRQILGAQQHQDLPLGQILDIVRPPRSTAHAPVFQVMFAWQNVPPGKLELENLEASTYESQAGGTAKFDLSLSLQEVDGRIVGAMEYATALFDRATIGRHLEHWRTVLEAMLADDQQTLCRLSLLTPAQRRQVVVEWNATAVAYPKDRCLHQLFEEQTDRTPEGIAVVFEDDRLSYAELNRRANRLTDHLRSIGIGPDDRVAICVERSIEMVIAVLATLKAGGAYVPLDPEYPPERLEYMVADSSPSVVLLHRATEGLIRGSSAAQRVVLSDAVTRSSTLSSENAVASGGLRASHLAYVIYTSGSTGNPKGAMNEHRGVVNRLSWMQDQYRLSAEDRVLQKAPLSFDVSVWEIFWPLMCGAALVIARPRSHRDPSYLSALIRAAAVTTAHFVPSMLQSFMDHGDANRCGSLARVICSGEALPATLVRRFHDALPDTKIHNLYGPTEAAIDVSAWECRADDHRSSTPIGRPIANTQIYILDARREPVPIGVAGELYLGGVQVGRGYYNRPELTADRFVSDPFSPLVGARLYRTGDLGRWLPDGVIDYLGRNDAQLMVRGFRIEPGEIEARLTAINGVREAVVVAREDRDGDKRLVAYVVCEGTHGHDGAALRDALSKHLPHYMLPGAYVKVAELPRSVNGKLDRSALPTPGDDAYASQSFSPPDGVTETTLAELWSTLLRRDLIGRHDDFFALGGHSLLAVQLASRVRRRFNVELALADLFSRPVLSDLAQRIEGMPLQRRHARVTAFRQSGTRAPLFLVHHLTGSCGYVRNLLPSVDADVPIYGLTASGFNAGEMPLNSVKDMAASYIDEMRQVQARGPYRIAGHSVGGIFALEIARQLVSSGEPVGFLGLIDTHGDWGHGDTPPDPASPSDFAAANADADALARSVAVQRGIASALASHRISALPMKPDLYAAKESFALDPTLGWGESIFSQMRLQLIDGSHDTMLGPPHVVELGAALSRSLDAISGSMDVEGVKDLGCVEIKRRA